MKQRTTSAYENSISLLKKLFKSTQYLLHDLYKSPLMLDDDMPILDLWLNEKGIKNIMNSLCIDVEMHDRYKVKS